MQGCTLCVYVCVCVCVSVLLLCRFYGGFLLDGVKAEGMRHVVFCHAGNARVMCN